MEQNVDHETANTAPEVQTLEPAKLLEIARATGLRQLLHGVNATDAREKLAEFVAAVNASRASQTGQAALTQCGFLVEWPNNTADFFYRASPKPETLAHWKNAGASVSTVYVKEPAPTPDTVELPTPNIDTQKFGDLLQSYVRATQINCNVFDSAVKREALVTHIIDQMRDYARAVLALAPCQVAKTADVVERQAYEAMTAERDRYRKVLDEAVAAPEGLIKVLQFVLAYENDDTAVIAEIQDAFSQQALVTDAQEFARSYVARKMRAALEEVTTAPEEAQPFKDSPVSAADPRRSLVESCSNWLGAHSSAVWAQQFGHSELMRHYAKGLAAEAAAIRAEAMDRPDAKLATMILSAAKAAVSWLDHANCADLPDDGELGSMRSDMNKLRELVRGQPDFTPAGPCKFHGDGWISFAEQGNPPCAVGARVAVELLSEPVKGFFHQFKENSHALTYNHGNFTHWRTAESEEMAPGMASICSGGAR